MSPDGGWQTQAWGFYDDTPEVRFAATWIGNSMGRARLFAGRRMDDGSVAPLESEHPASLLVAEIAGGPSGQSQFLAELGPHLVVAGEAWVIIDPSKPSDEAWHLVSTEEVSRQGQSLRVEIEGREVTIPLGADEFDDEDTTPMAIRLWQPHPRRHIEADSPIRSSFALLEELRLLNAAVASIAKSRLTGRGIVFIPQGTKFPTSPGGDGAEDDLLATLMDVASTAYRDPSSAAASVPIFLEVPAEFIGQVNRVTFESDFDDLAVKLREETIRRFATGLDTPPEVLLGQGGTNHWSVWFIDESGIRLAVEPRLTMACDALTTQWLRPVLEAQGVPDASECLVWFDASDLRVKTNRGETAFGMYDRGEINGDALRRETSFDDTDKLSEAERREALIVRMVTQAPSLAPMLLPLIGFNLSDIGITGPSQDEEGGGGELESPDIPVDEDRSPPAGPPAEPPQPSEGLLAAVDGVIWRALERAGQRARSRVPRSVRGKLESCEAASVHVVLPIDREAIDNTGLLDDAWTRVPEVARRYGVDPDCLESAIDEYCRDLIVAGVEHCFEQTRAVLAAPCITAGQRLAEVTT